MPAINEKKPGDSGYVCFYNRKRIEVYASGSWQAQELAAKYFKARKSYQVAVVVAERPDGTEVEHTADF